MSVNKFLPHIFVLPEDDANRQIINGFVLNFESNQLQVLNEAGGWVHVIESFKRDHVRAMRQYPSRFMILLIDFDDCTERLQKIRVQIPDDLSERVFVLGARKEPENVKRFFACTFEEMGKKLADSCRSQDKTIWNHQCLSNNSIELDRVYQIVCSSIS